VPTYTADGDADFPGKPGQRVLQVLLALLRRLEAIGEDGQLCRRSFATVVGNAG